MSIEYIKLANGIRVVHKKNNAPVAHLGVFINAGSRDEMEEEQGLAHFIEHVVFKGTKKRKAYHILNNLDNVGGDINAYTTKEETCIYASFLTEYYTRAADLLSDICFNSIFPEKEIEKEKEVIYDEINQYLDTPSEQIFDDFENLIFEGHPMGRSILGDKKKIKAFKRDDIVRFINNNYHTDQIVISSVGNIELKKLKQIVCRFFADIPENLRKKEREPIKTYLPVHQTVKRKNHQVHAIIGAPSYGYADKEKTTMTLLNNLLGGPALNCRLNMNIRERFGFCYSIDSNYLPYSDTGIFTIYFATDNKHIEKVEALVLKELKKLKDQKLGTLQMMRAKNQLKGQIAISNESKLYEMLAIGKSLLVYNEVDSIEQVYEKIDTLTPENILNAAGFMFDENRFSKLIYKNGR